MEPLTGQPVELSFITGTTWDIADDLVYYDGPLVVHYGRADGTHWLYWFVDQSDTHCRWALLCLPLQAIEAFDLSVCRPLWQQATRVMLADMDATGTPDALTELTLEELPADYWPNA